MIIRPLAIATLTLCLAACGGEGSDKNGGGTPTPPPVTETPKSLPTPEPVPTPTPEATTDELPASLGSGDAVAGGPQYVQYCSSCHGEKGCGGGPLGEALNPKPALHCDGDYMNPKSDEHLFKVIKFGGGAVDLSPLMAPWGGTLSDAQIVDVVAFVRSLADPPYQAGE